jgi:hypothetical protein
MTSVNTRHHYGIVVGINDYTGFSPLRHAIKDAEDFYEWLVDPNGGNVDPKNTELITSTAAGGAGKPEREQIITALKKIKDSCFEHVKLHPEDWQHTRLYLFVSGHGIAPQPDEAALLMANAEPSSMGYHFACKRYLDWFELSTIFRELVFFADCCRNSASNVPIHPPPWNEFKGNNGKVLTLRGYATYFGEKAFEEGNGTGDPDKLRGYFTKILLDALRNGSNPETKKIDSVWLASYVTERVKSITKADLNFSQEPYFVPVPAAPLIIFREDIEPTEYEVTITLPPGYMGGTKLYDGSLRLIAEQQNQHGKWIINLKNGLYLVKIADETIPLRNNGYFQIVGSSNTVSL